MATRGRKSSAALAIQPFAVLAERRPSPPPGLTEAEEAVWRDTVGCMPGGWLNRARAPLLTAFCRHVARASFLSGEINRFEPDWLQADGGVERLGRLLAAAEREDKAMLAMARALRLTPQSQYGPRRAATINAEATDQPRPWET